MRKHGLAQGIRKAIKKASSSKLEDSLAWAIRCSGLPKPVYQFKFHPERRWRSDLAWPDRKLLVEIEGGTWSNGRHTRGSGFEKDCEKYNEAAILGYRILRVTGGMVKSGAALRYIERLL